MSIIKRPLITEKSIEAAKKGRYTFIVDSKVTKKEIQRGVADQFKVNVVSLRTITLKGKKRRAGKKRIEIEESPIKKAIVQILPEQKIEIFEMGEK